MKSILLESEYLRGYGVRASTSTCKKREKERNCRQNILPMTRYAIRRSTAIKFESINPDPFISSIVSRVSSSLFLSSRVVSVCGVSGQEESENMSWSKPAITFLLSSLLEISSQHDLVNPLLRLDDELRIGSQRTSYSMASKLLTFRNFSSIFPLSQTRSRLVRQLWESLTQDY